MFHKVFKLFSTVFKRQKMEEKGMKKALVFIAIALIVIALLAQTAMAFFYPGPTPTDDKLFNKWGPVINNLLIVPYGGAEAEYLAFKGKKIDLMDWPLLASQVAELNSLDPNMKTYARAFYVDRGMRQFDLNNMRFPLNDVNFRRALSHCFDKDAFIATQLAGLGLRMDSPLASHGDPYYNHYCDNLYPFSLQTAADILLANGYSDKDGDGFIEGPRGEKITLVMYARADDPDRSAMGQIFATNLEVGLKGTTLNAGIDVDLRLAPKSECFQKVMVQFDYHIYTGGWGFGRDPDTLYFLYKGEFAQAFPYTPNYPGYSNPEFDYWAEKMLTAPTMDEAIEAVHKMQEILMDDAGVIPVFTYASYSAALADVKNLVNMLGTGLGTWFNFWTLINAYREDTDTLRWGFLNDIETFNGLHAEWVWDDQLLSCIYSSLIAFNPYNVAEDFGMLAMDWKLGEWTYQGEKATYVEFKLREDVYWHDIPPKPDRKTPGGKPLLPGGATNVPFTAEDVALTILMNRDIPDAWNHDAVADVVYVEVLDPYTIRVYYGVYMPLWALHWVGGLNILPKHVFGPVYEERLTRQFDPFGEKCLAGVSAFMMDYEGSKIHEYYKLVANKRYFAYHPVDVYGILDSPTHRVSPGSRIKTTFYLYNRDSKRTIAAGTLNVKIELKAPGGAITTVYEGKNPELPPFTKVEFYTYTGTVEKGIYEIKASIDPDPVTGHADPDGYTVHVWSTIIEDINMDIKVDIIDVATAAKAFATKPGDPRWDPKADVNKDLKVDILDLARIARMFGWK